MFPTSRMRDESSPSRHSRVASDMKPYSSAVGTTFGFMSKTEVCLSGPRYRRAWARVRQHDDLAAAAGPMTKTQCRMTRSSSSWVTLRTKSSSGHSPISSHARRVHCVSVASTTRGGSRPGKRSLRRPEKTTSSTSTIFAMLKSRSARMRRMSSASSGSARLSIPATTSTDLIARRPQS